MDKICKYKISKPKKKVPKSVPKHKNFAIMYGKKPDMTFDNWPNIDEILGFW